MSKRRLISALLTLVMCNTFIVATTSCELEAPDNPIIVPAKEIGSDLIGTWRARSGSDFIAFTSSSASVSINGSVSVIGSDLYANSGGVFSSGGTLVVGYEFINEAGLRKMYDDTYGAGGYDSLIAQNDANGQSVRWERDKAITGNMARFYLKALNLYGYFYR
jgi:hypothetical protein